ncbi:MAG: hypothetical protein GX758_03060, partial [Tenericutes bacterium]|nr:hypothetical protein [Mycoplasmatota bacterium]
ELLAVIAILAILIIIALPNILKMFNNAKKNSFVSESRSLYKTAQQNFISTNGGAYCYSNMIGFECDELDMTGRKNFDYYVQFNESGEIETIHMYDGNYCIFADVYYDDLDSDYVEIDYLTSEITEEGYDCRPCGLGGLC